MRGHDLGHDLVYKDMTPEGAAGNELLLAIVSTCNELHVTDCNELLLVVVLTCVRVRFGREQTAACHHGRHDGI
jgi:hypothetical protein